MQVILLIQDDVTKIHYNISQLNSDMHQVT